MIHIVRAPPFILALLLGLGCGGRVDDSSGSDRGRVGGEASDSGGDAFPARDASVDPPVAVDASSASDVVAAPMGTLDCLSDPTAASDPSDFQSLSWNREHMGCDMSSRCVVFVKLDAGCSLWVQANDVPRTITMDPADCLALKKWFTSDRLAAGLRDLARCEGKPWTGNPEITEVTRASTGWMGGKYEKSCTVEPFGENRTCIQRALDIYAPDVRILP